MVPHDFKGGGYGRRDVGTGAYAITTEESDLLAANVGKSRDVRYPKNREEYDGWRKDRPENGVALTCVDDGGFTNTGGNRGRNSGDRFARETEGSSHTNQSTEEARVNSGGDSVSGIWYARQRQPAEGYEGKHSYTNRGILQRERRTGERTSHVSAERWRMCEHHPGQTGGGGEGSSPVTMHAASFVGASTRASNMHNPKNSEELASIRAKKESYRKDLEAQV